MKKFLFFLFIIVHILLLSAQNSTSTGTGFFVSAEGHIITCAHVIENGGRITVKVGNSEHQAQVIAKSVENDLALLKITYRNPYHFRISNFNNTKLGDKIFVLGFPFSDLLGSSIRLTDGIVSAQSGINADQRYFQISAPVQPGNSGGPIFTEDFTVVGVAAEKLNDLKALLTSGSIPQNMNFGVKSDLARNLDRNVSFGSGNIKDMSNAIAATVQIVYRETYTSTSTVRIANNTGYTVWFIYMSATNASDWEEDILGEDVLLNGQQVNVRLGTPLARVSRYDIRMIDSDGDTYTKWNVALTQNMIVEFTIVDLDF